MIVVDTTAMFISSVILECALHYATHVVDDGAVITELVAAAKRHSCFHIFQIEITWSGNALVIFSDTKVGQ